MLIWPRVVCGSTMCHLAHLWSASSQVVWALASGVQEPSWSPFNVEWECYVRAGGVDQSFPLLGGFSCKVYLQHLSKILL
jgi:hypothetical protein